MAKIITIDEMLDTLRRLDQEDPDPHTKRAYLAIENQIKTLGNELAGLVRTKLDINSGECTIEGSDLAGSAVAFYPSKEGQPVPQVLVDLNIDSESDWEMPWKGRPGAMFNPAGQDISGDLKPKPSDTKVRRPR
jgi:hypothetical protein